MYGSTRLYCSCLLVYTAHDSCCCSVHERQSQRASTGSSFFRRRKTGDGEDLASPTESQRGRENSSASRRKSLKRLLSELQRKYCVMQLRESPHLHDQIMRGVRACFSFLTFHVRVFSCAQGHVHTAHNRSGINLVTRPSVVDLAVRTRSDHKKFWLFFERFPDLSSGFNVPWFLLDSEFNLVFVSGCSRMKV